MTRFKVMHLIGSMDLGGAEKLTRLVVEGLPGEEFEVSVCCIKCGGFYAEQLKEKGYRVYELLGVQKNTSVSVASFVKASWLLFRLLRKERPDILHTHLFATSCLGRIAAKLAGVRRTVTTLHRIEYPRVQSKIEPLFRALTNLYITDSRAAATASSCTLDSSARMSRAARASSFWATAPSTPRRGVRAAPSRISR